MPARKNEELARSTPGALGAGRSFGWPQFLVGVVAGAVMIFTVGLVMDQALIALGVPLSPVRDAAYSAIFGFVFAAPGLLAVWRIGIVTLRQYILAALILFAPLTVLSLFLVQLFDDVILSAPWLPTGDIDAHDLAYTAYVKIARSAVLTPFFLLGFWAVYHRAFGCMARRPK